MSSLRRIRPIDIFLGFLFVALVLFGVYSYISRERMIYSWDEANYTSLTEVTYDAFFPAHPDPPSDSFRPVYGLKFIHSSFGLEYNYLFALPLAFFERFFGTSRTAWMLGAFALYFVPLCVFWGLVAQRIFNLPKRIAFWGTLGLGLIVVPNYLALLRGFPDVGGATLLGLAVLLYLRDMQLRSLWQRIAIGLILCVMPLFRRHFMYSLCAFLLAAILQHAYILIQTLRRDPREAGRYFLCMAGRLITIGVTIAAVWLVFAYPFVHLLVSNNYFKLYEGFMIPPGQVLSAFVSAYGYLFCILAVLGYLFGYRYKILNGAPAIFVTILGCLNLLQWVFIVRQLGPHYMNHFSIYLIFGVLASIATIVKKTNGIPRYALLFTVAAVLINRFAFSFAWMKAIDSPDPVGFGMAQRPPVVRSDYNEIKRLVTYLRENAPDGPATYVASSSWIMNYDALHNAEGDMFGKQNRKLNIVVPPVIDSRDWFPVDMLLKSDYVFTVTPIQYSVPAENAKLVTMAVNAFEQDTPLAKDFERIPGEYKLLDGAVGKLYRRIRTASFPTALSELAREQAILPTPPGRQKDWVSLDGDNRWDLQGEKSPYILILREIGYRSPTLSREAARHRKLVYVGATPPGSKLEAKVGLEGRWTQQTVTINPVWVDPVSGAPTGAESKTWQVASVKNGETISLRIPPMPEPSIKARLLLDITLPEEADPQKKETPDARFVLYSLQMSP